MKKLALVLCIVGGLTYPSVQAGGIPVIDSANIAQSAMNSLKELAEMAKQLQEAKNQLTELKKQVKAISGVKGFSDILDAGGIEHEITASLSDLLNGNLSSLTAKGGEHGIKCEESQYSGKNYCEDMLLTNISQLDYIEKLEQQFEKKAQKITELSERIKSAQDIKSMSELQANISLEANSLALLQQQTSMYMQLTETKARLAYQKARQDYAKKEWEDFLNPANSSKSGSKKIASLLD